MRGAKRYFLADQVRQENEMPKLTTVSNMAIRVFFQWYKKGRDGFWLGPVFQGTLD